MEGAIPITQLVVDLITAIGVGPFILILFSLFTVVNAPSIIDKITSRRSQRRQLERDDKVKATLKEVVESVQYIAAMMRNVISEKDALRIISLKMGSVEDFKTRLVAQIKQVIKSSKGARNCQFRRDMKAVIDSEWHDLKSEFEAFNLPFSMRMFLNRFDKELWEEAGIFEMVRKMALDEKLDIDRKMAAISKQIDIGLRSIQAKLASHLENEYGDQRD